MPKRSQTHSPQTQERRHVAFLYLPLLSSNNLNGHQAEKETFRMLLHHMYTRMQYSIENGQTVAPQLCGWILQTGPSKRKPATATQVQLILCDPYSRAVKKIYFTVTGLGTGVTLAQDE